MTDAQSNTVGKIADTQPRESAWTCGGQRISGMRLPQKAPRAGFVGRAGRQSPARESAGREERVMSVGLAGIGGRGGLDVPGLAQRFGEGRAQLGDRHRAVGFALDGEGIGRRTIAVTVRHAPYEHRRASDGICQPDGLATLSGQILIEIHVKKDNACYPLMQ